MQPYFSNVEMFWWLIVSVQAAVTECHKLTGWQINNRNFLFLTVLEAGSPSTRCQHGHSLLRVLFRAVAFSLCPRMEGGARKPLGASL